MNLGFVLVALFDEIGCVAIKDVHVLRLNVDVAEKVVPHERVVGFRVRFRQGNILVHVESDDIFERDAPFAVDLNQSFVRLERRRASRAAENESSIGDLKVGVDAFCYVFADLR